MAGDRVAELHVALVEVSGGEPDGVAAVGSDRDRPRLFVDLEDRRPGAVAHAEGQVIAATDDAVSGGQLDVARNDSLRAAAAGAFHQLLARCVEVGDVGSAQADHHVAGRVASAVLPPVGDEGGLRVVRVGGDDKPARLDGVGEVVERVAVSDGLEQVVLDRIELSAVLVKFDGTESLGDLGEESSRADARQLVRIADQDRLAAGALDHLEQRRQ